MNSTQTKANIYVFFFKGLWIMAAKYEFETNESIETARNLFQRALRFLPTSQKLWTEVNITFKLGICVANRI